MQDSLSYIRNKLFKWYKINGRDFPWRHSKNPYRIMIAEFMLHRTKAEQVVAVYKEFIEKYPDVKSLASAELNEIKKVTEHLGLHWRAKHFITSANYIVEKYNGNIPANPEDILKIPGIGDYITGAIMVICFNKKYSVVDSNIARFLNRFFNLEIKGEIRRKKKIVVLSEQLFNSHKKTELLFALIDFCSLICKPIRPLCLKCSLFQRCMYKNKNKRLTYSYPPPSP
ncbi:MAG: DNA glycosylase [Ignavibacteria bacterium]|jgi:A/G-specific adenine glycosylase|nr:DNA glycosylase [Ignavibacteria bacterium]MDH7528973.1 DNA glycosylase [Ignavibacteria bacterium]